MNFWLRNSNIRGSSDTSWQRHRPASRRALVSSNAASPSTPLDRSRTGRATLLVLAVLFLGSQWSSSLAQSPFSDRGEVDVPSLVDDSQQSMRSQTSDANGLSPDIEQDGRVDDEATRGSSSIPPLNIPELFLKGRWLMLPIALMSIAVLTLAIERGFATRRSRVIPHGLLEGLTELDGAPGVMDPRRAYRLCQRYPSPAATIIQTMLLKVGRPHTEVERAVTEASEREADRLYGHARWLNLIAAVAPLTGLLGTVWGMIRAFYDTTHLPLGQNKADYLAEGIYVALVTTLGGLVVAIPAAIFAHYFEGRVVNWFHQIDELLFQLMPQVERYEGRVRMTPHSLGGLDDAEIDELDDEEDFEDESNEELDEEALDTPRTRERRRGARRP